MRAKTPGFPRRRGSAVVTGQLVFHDEKALLLFAGEVGQVSVTRKR